MKSGGSSSISSSISIISSSGNSRCSGRFLQYWKMSSNFIWLNRALQVLYMYIYLSASEWIVCWGRDHVLHGSSTVLTQGFCIVHSISHGMWHSSQLWYSIVLYLLLLYYITVFKGQSSQLDFVPICSFTSHWSGTEHRVTRANSLPTHTHTHRDELTHVHTHERTHTRIHAQIHAGTHKHTHSSTNNRAFSDKSTTLGKELD